MNFVYSIKFEKKGKIMNEKSAKYLKIIKKWKMCHDIFHDIFKS